MRGDRPDEKPLQIRDCRATPHARGSTARRHDLDSRDIGYPACAGIDLVWRIAIRAYLRLPRMCGDRPQFGERKAQTVAATPHARGSTYTLLHILIVCSGYPACAGIDPNL